MYNFHESRDLDFLEKTTIDEPTDDEEGLDEGEESLDEIDDSLDAGLDE